MKKIKLFLVFSFLILILGTEVLNADGTFTEHFTPATMRINTSSTTALVDMGSGGRVGLPLNISEVGSLGAGGSRKNFIPARMSR